MTQPKTISIHFHTIRQAKKFIRHCLNEGLLYADLEGELHIPEAGKTHKKKPDNANKFPKERKNVPDDYIPRPVIR